MPKNVVAHTSPIDNEPAVSVATPMPTAMQLTERMMALDLVVDKELLQAKGETDRSSFVWRAPVFDGELSHEIVVAIIAKGKAEALECRLSAVHAQRLLPETASIEDALREIAKEYNGSVERAKATLRGNTSRTIAITGQVREQDPNYPALDAARREVEGRDGAVWGDFEPTTGREVHYIVKWSEFPDVKKLLDAQAEMVGGRSAVVRSWIEREYWTVGLSLFAVR